MTKKSKFYFREDDECCYTVESHLEYMKENCINEMKVFEAERETKSDYFWCKYYGETGEVGEGCGKMCDEYKPLNGKNGRCYHYGFCYEPTEKFIILKYND